MYIFLAEKIVLLSLKTKFYRSFQRLRRNHSWLFPRKNKGIKKIKRVAILLPFLTFRQVDQCVYEGRDIKVHFQNGLIFPNIFH